ncbi:MAG: CHASE2 domain-containing protein [Elusimicrobiota bacterium]
MKKSFLVDAAIGLLLTLFVAGSYLVGHPLLESVELKTYDMRSKLRDDLNPSKEIVLIAIDNNSIAALGRWPWPRSRLAAMVDKLAAAGPRLIGLDIVFSEAEQNQGIAEIARLEERYNELTAARSLIDKGGLFKAEFSSAAVRLDSDSKLAASIKQAGNVVLPMFFSEGGQLGAKPDEVPPSISSSSLSYQMSQSASAMSTPDGAKANFPILQLAEGAAGIGHVSIEQDLDGTLRHELPVYRYGDYHYPSFAVQLVLAYAGVKSNEGVFTPGKSISVGKFTIPLDARNQMLITYNGPEQTFRTFSYQDVMNDKVSMDAFKDKIVIIGPTASGVATVYVTPLTANFPPIETIATVVENILHSKYMVRPVWSEKAEWGLLGVVGLFIMFVLPRLRALAGLVVSLVLMAGLMGAGTHLFVQGQWVKVAYPSILLGLGYLVITSKRFLVTEKGKELVEASAIETNKMLGLSFQGQGMLDMAFEKFRLCPLDDNMKDTLYNLALDFERKRQFSKAAAVFDHIAAKDPKYKDIEAKTTMLKAASEGAVFGGIGGAKKDGTVMLSGGSTKPTLGRYEIEKELGRGAMGIVYLGKDPKINRQVAIKTMMLDEGGDAASTKEVKERFFREAESAGTLNHPNIVRIFDAGEESDISYIAMELLDGKDLVQFVGKDKLLSPVQAMEYVAVVADALDYAHAQGIVHRDIKPANIMLLKDGTIRVADFGIARITASSKTATGTVMGTPSYMSPEQVAGKKVDGRADLFSLTVALYEFLTGEKPFKGGEGIGTLLFQIANDPHPDILTIRPELPPCVKPIIDKGLAKNPDERYARGSLLASALRAAIVAIKSGVPTPPKEPPAPAASAVLSPEVLAMIAPPEPVAPDTAEVTLPPPPVAEIPAPEPVAAATIPAFTFDYVAPAQPSPDATITMDSLAGLQAAPASEPAPTLEAAPVIEFTIPEVQPAAAAEPQVPEPALPSSPSPDATLVIERTSVPAFSPDATIRLAPKPPQEPS